MVIGVANGINLVEVTLPRLAARGCEPNVVRFNAYDNAQLKRLLRQRLGALPFAVFEDAGLELCARKVAAATGDMRRALNICAVAVDLCAREAADLCAANDEERAKEKETQSLKSKPEPRFSGALVKVAHGVHHRRGKRRRWWTPCAACPSTSRWCSARRCARSASARADPEPEARNPREARWAS